MSEQGEWVAVASVSEMEDGKGKAITVNGQRRALFLVEGKYHCLDEECPHVGAPLSEGQIMENKYVRCPWHAARFELETGKTQGPPAGSDVHCYEVKVEGDSILTSVKPA